MDYGFRAINEGGIVQIDNLYKNLSFISKGTVSPTTSFPVANAGTSYYGTVTVTNCDNPILAIRTSSTNKACVFQTLRTGPTTCVFYVAGLINGQAIEYYVFDTLKGGELVDTDYGLRVNNPPDGIIYDSRKKALHVLDLQITQTTLEYNFSYPGKKVAVIQSQRTQWQNVVYVPIGVPTEVFYFSFHGSVRTPTDSTVFISDMQLFANNSSIASGIIYYDYSIENGASMIVDVTNF